MNNLMLVVRSLGALAYVVAFPLAMSLSYSHGWQAFLGVMFAVMILRKAAYSVNRQSE